MTQMEGGHAHRHHHHVAAHLQTVTRRWWQLPHLSRHDNDGMMSLFPYPHSARTVLVQSMQHEVHVQRHSSNLRVAISAAVLLPLLPPNTNREPAPRLHPAPLRPQYHHKPRHQSCMILLILGTSLVSPVL